jgi:WD40-like Beta Propeller Repeat.
MVVASRYALPIPLGKRNKMQVLWHPSGNWIIFAGERLYYNEIWLPKRLRQGWLECGIWMDIYAIKPDGGQCVQLAKPKGGFTGVAFSPDGKRGVYAEALGMVPKAVFGKWALKIADFEERDGIPILVNTRDITPPGAVWLEPGCFSPKGVDISLNADIGMQDAQGQDQYIMIVDTLELRNLTNSPQQWDEHGVFSPDGEKILNEFLSLSQHQKFTQNSWLED